MKSLLLLAALAICAPLALAGGGCDAGADGQCVSSGKTATYLNLPRLTFAGYFQADVATGNNDPIHFDVANWRSAYSRQAASMQEAGGWNPQGTLAFRFLDCKITSLTYQDGSSVSYDTISGSAVGGPFDPLLTGFVEDSNDTVAAKIVDLDPEFQLMVSQLFGMKISVHHGFRGNMATVAFQDLWARWTSTPISAANTPDFGVFYQSVLENVQWATESELFKNSRFLKQLHGAATALNPRKQTLSIKFALDGFNKLDFTANNFTFGRVVGVIGLHSDNEPRFFLNRRSPVHVANATSQGQGSLSGVVSQLFRGYAQINDKTKDQPATLVLDLMNSLGTAIHGANFANQGNLVVTLCKTPIATISPFEYCSNDWYLKTAAIVSIPLTPDQQKQASSCPIGLRSSVSAIEEHPDGEYVHADEFVYRLYPGDSQIVKLYVTKFGAPHQGLYIRLANDTTQYDLQDLQGPISTQSVHGVPAEACTSTVSPSDAHGIALLTITTKDPKALNHGKDPRKFIEGQLYSITYDIAPREPPTWQLNLPSSQISVLVYNGYEKPAKPSWMNQIGPLLLPYALMYPAMKPVVDLSSYSSIVAKIKTMRAVFNSRVGIDDPLYMPVTRDMNPRKREMLVQWLNAQNPPLYMDKGNVQDLMLALQTAIELEHSTIPPYLTALYSIKPGFNTEITTLIRSVVLEEMLHMSLMCNILVSIGGSPNISHAGFIPFYPTTLPGGVAPGLVVRLRKFSIEHVRDVFLGIEQPEEEVLERNDAWSPSSQKENSSFTIHWFYSQLNDSLKELHKQGKIVFNKPETLARQLDGPLGVFKIKSLEDAIRAIDIITAQGEGASARDPLVNKSEPRSALGLPPANASLGHYFRFKEIVHGRRLIPCTPDISKCGSIPKHKRRLTMNYAGNPNEPPLVWSYDGEEIAFDPEGVWPMKDDPDLDVLPAHSRARVTSGTFARQYEKLLKALHNTFNGFPDQINNAIGLMQTLAITANRLMQEDIGDGTGRTAGPSFQTPWKPDWKPYGPGDPEILGANLAVAP